MASEAAKGHARRVWRELGFFCGKDKAAKEWRVVGSVAGLRGFAALIRTYASNPAHDRLSEYMHLGPVTNLEVGTWEQPDITDQGIAGSLPDLLNLAGLIELNVRANMVGRRIALRSSYSPLASYDLILEVRDEAFDPASADPACGES